MGALLNWCLHPRLSPTPTSRRMTSLPALNKDDSARQIVVATGTNFGTHQAEAEPTGFFRASSTPEREGETFLSRYGPLIAGIVEAQIGMIMFNLGLTYGFTSIGDQVRRTPALRALGVTLQAFLWWFRTTQVV